MPGFVFYDGPSLIDGAPIIGIAVLESSNAKTGNMVQTYILRADMAPLAAIASGDDVSTAGTARIGVTSRPGARGHAMWTSPNPFNPFSPHGFVALTLRWRHRTARASSPAAWCASGPMVTLPRYPRATGAP